MRTSFAVADSYRTMRDGVFKEYQVTANNGFSYKTPDYEENIFKMRLKLRSQAYLAELSEKNDLKSFRGEKLDKKLLELKEFGQDIRRQNILHMMNSDDFFTSLPSQRLDVLETKINSVMEVEEQIKILLSCEDDPEMRADSYQY